MIGFNWYTLNADVHVDTIMIVTYNFPYIYATIKDLCLSTYGSMNWLASVEII